MSERTEAEREESLNLMYGYGSEEIARRVAEQAKNRTIDWGTMTRYLEDKDHGVAKVTAMLRGNEYNAWRARYLPMIREEGENIVSGVNIDKAIGQAQESVTQSFAGARKGLQMHNTGLGLSQSEAQKNQQRKSMGLSEVAQRVSAVNDARVSATDRDMAIVSGGFNGSIDTSKEVG